MENLTPEEMVINQPAKEEFVRDRLALLGLLDPRISGEIQPYSINHDVAVHWMGYIRLYGLPRR